MPRKLLEEFEPGHEFTKMDRDEVSDPHEPTDEQFAQAKPFAKMFPELNQSIKRGRGKQKSPTKELISLRVDQDVLSAFRATGAGWQKRISEALREKMVKGLAGVKPKAEKTVRARPSKIP
jgi:uncharacterized protein (DUF4415 family)